ncbi:unnamed protein product, partial [Polarella glacialis]
SQEPPPVPAERAFQPPAPPSVEPSQPGSRWGIGRAGKWLFFQGLKGLGRRAASVSASKVQPPKVPPMQKKKEDDECSSDPGRSGQSWCFPRSSKKVLTQVSSYEDPLREVEKEDPAIRALSLIAEVDQELELTRKCPLFEKRKIFRELQRRLHPDKNPEQAEAAKLAFQHLMDRSRTYLKN